MSSSSSSSSGNKKRSAASSSSKKKPKKSKSSSSSSSSNRPKTMDWTSGVQSILRGPVTSVQKDQQPGRINTKQSSVGDTGFDLGHRRTDCWQRMMPTFDPRFYVPPEQIVAEAITEDRGLTMSVKINDECTLLDALECVRVNVSEAVEHCAVMGHFDDIGLMTQQLINRIVTTPDGSDLYERLIAFSPQEVLQPPPPPPPAKNADGSVRAPPQLPPEMMVPQLLKTPAEIRRDTMLAKSRDTVRTDKLLLPLRSAQMQRYLEIMFRCGMLIFILRDDADPQVVPTLDGERLRSVMYEGWYLKIYFMDWSTNSSISMLMPSGICSGQLRRLKRVMQYDVRFDATRNLDAEGWMLMTPIPQVHVAGQKAEAEKAVLESNSTVPSKEALGKTAQPSPGMGSLTTIDGSDHVTSSRGNPVLTNREIAERGGMRWAGTGGSMNAKLVQDDADVFTKASMGLHNSHSDAKRLQYLYGKGDTGKLVLRQRSDAMQVQGAVGRPAVATDNCWDVTFLTSGQAYDVNITQDKMYALMRTATSMGVYNPVLLRAFNAVGHSARSSSATGKGGSSSNTGGGGTAAITSGGVGGAGVADQEIMDATEINYNKQRLKVLRLVELLIPFIEENALTKPDVASEYISDTGCGQGGKYYHDMVKMRAIRNTAAATFRKG